MEEGLKAWLKEAPGGREASRLRSYETVDIARRRGVIAPRRVHLTNYPVNNPVAIFNPAIAFRRGCPDCFSLYARIIMGYYKYVSAIAKIDLNLPDILEGSVSASHYSGELIIAPSTRYDIWGTEDPRATIIGDEYYMTYVGRTANYFNPRVWSERTLPVTAVSSGNGKWEKRYVFLLPDELRPWMVSNKDSFIVEAPEDGVIVFHRPHLRLDHGDLFILAVSKVSWEEMRKARESFDDVREVYLKEAWRVMEPAPYESKLGWSSPPIELKPGVYLLLAHGVDKDTEIYRVFAMMLDYRGEAPRILAVTPRYVMEPRMNYEIYGDRPYVVFPCGALRVDDQLLISYGASDYFASLATMHLDDLLAELDNGKIA